MEYLGLGFLALVVLVGAIVMARMMRSSGRNNESTHGGGAGGMSSGVDQGPH